MYCTQNVFLRDPVANWRQMPLGGQTKLPIVANFKLA